MKTRFEHNKNRFPIKNIKVFLISIRTKNSISYSDTDVSEKLHFH